MASKHALTRAQAAAQRLARHLARYTSRQLQHLRRFMLERVVQKLAGLADVVVFWKDRLIHVLIDGVETVFDHPPVPRKRKHLFAA